MTDTPIDFINIFVQPPGDLLYYLAVIAIAQTSFFMALSQRLRRRGERPPGRFMLATLGTVIVWALLMIGALFALLSGEPAEALLPPLERAAQMVTLILLGWAFLTADHEPSSRAGNLIALGLIGLVILGYVYTGMEWITLYPTTEFNSSGFGATWTFIPSVLAMTGIILSMVYWRYVTDAPLKVVYFVIMLLGAVGTMLWIGQGNFPGNYAGGMRLAFLTSLLILPAMIYRTIVTTLEMEIESLSGTNPVVLPQHVPPTPLEHTPLPPAERESAQLMRALGLILEKATPDAIPEKIIMAALTVLKADIGVLFSSSSPHYADVKIGIDRAMGRNIVGSTINLDEQPTLVNAIERRQQRPLYPDRNADELHDLYTRLDIDVIGPAYFQPLVSEKELLAVLMIGLPYAGRELTGGEQELLKGIAIIAASLLALSQSARESRLMAENRAIQTMLGGNLANADQESVLSVMHESEDALDEAREQINVLSQQVTQLKVELDDERSRVAARLGDTQEGVSVSQRMLAMSAEQERLRDEGDRLMARLREAETALASVSTGDNDAIYKTLIEAINRERDELKAQRDRLQAELQQIRAAGASPVPAVVTDMITRMSDEKARLEIERDALSDKLTDLEAQLNALGIEEGTAGIVQVIGQMFEQRAQFQARFEQAKTERDALLTERARYEEAITREDERELRLSKLQTEIKNLAADREAGLKQRDRLRSEREEMLARQEELRQQANRLLAEAVGFEKELSDSQEEVSELRQQVKGLADQLSMLNSERERLTAELRAAESERDGLLARVEGDREKITQAGEDGVGSLTRMIEQISTQKSDLEKALYQSRTALADAESKVQSLQVRQNAAPVVTGYQPDNPELLLGMLQELRTPMTSIVGYVELMLNESAGILGEMQRRFLQRVSANITRLTSMIDDLIRVTFLDAGSFALARIPVNVVEVIEDALTAAANQLREKALTVNLSLDDELPYVRGDREAISQIIGELLTNAYLASSPGKTITVTAKPYLPTPSMRSQNGKMASSIFVSIADNGGGIPPEDQTRVFARKYRAENPLIQGLGDTGVGLSVAKALVEAHSGSIWMETKSGVGSVFNFTLPIDQSPAEDDEPKAEARR